VGLFNSLGNLVGKAAVAVTKAVPKVLGVAGAVVPVIAGLAGGKVAQFGANFVGTQLQTTAGLLGSGVNFGSTGVFSNLGLGRTPAPKETSMAFNIGGLLSGIAGAIKGLTGANVPSIVSTVGNVASLASNFFPAVGAPQGGPTTIAFRPPAMPVSAARPALPAMAGAVATVGRNFFNKFPNLATAIQMYRNQGKAVTRKKLHSLLKRFGPEIIISGGILSAAAVNELMIAGPGHRRMNPGNVSALRRSVRRLESFHNLCMKVDKLRKPKCRTKGRSGSGQQFVRQG